MSTKAVLDRGRSAESGRPRMSDGWTDKEYTVQVQMQRLETKAADNKHQSKLSETKQEAQSIAGRRGSSRRWPKVEAEPRNV